MLYNLSLDHKKYNIIVLVTRDYVTVRSSYSRYVIIITMFAKASIRSSLSTKSISQDVGKWPALVLQTFH